MNRAISAHIIWIHDLKLLHIRNFELGYFCSNNMNPWSKTAPYKKLCYRLFLDLLTCYYEPYMQGQMRSISHSSWIYISLCNQCLSMLKLCVWFPPLAMHTCTTLCDSLPLNCGRNIYLLQLNVIVCQWIAAGTYSCTIKFASVSALQQEHILDTTSCDSLSIKCIWKVFLDNNISAKVEKCISRIN